MDYVFYYAPTQNTRLYARHPDLDEAGLARLFAYRHRLNFESFLSQAEIDAQLDLSNEAYRPVFMLSHNGRSSPVRIFDDSAFFPREGHITIALKRILDGAPTIAYATGQGERRALVRGGENHRRRMGQLSRRSAFANLGFDIVEITLDDPVPESVDVLVLAAPQSPYAPAQISRIRDYALRGGDIFVMAEPGANEILSPLLADFGLRFVEGEIVQTEAEYPSDLAFARFAPEGSAFGFEPFEGTVGGAMIAPSAIALEHVADTGFKTRRILEFEENTRLTSDRDLAIDVVGLGFALQRHVGDELQRVLVIGDADFLSSAVNDSTELAGLSTIDGSLRLAIMDWFSESAFPVDVSRPSATDNQLSLKLRHIDYVRLLFLGGVPLLLLMAGGGLLISRRQA